MYTFYLITGRIGSHWFSNDVLLNVHALFQKRQLKKVILQKDQKSPRIAMQSMVLLLVYKMVYATVYATA